MVYKNQIDRIPGCEDIESRNSRHDESRGVLVPTASLKIRIAAKAN